MNEDNKTSYPSSIRMLTSESSSIELYQELCKVIEGLEECKNKAFNYEQGYHFKSLRSDEAEEIKANLYQIDKPLMEYRIKEIEENGRKYYYPQKKKRWFWRRFVWWGGEDGTTPHTVFYSDMSSALAHIEDYKKYLEEKAVEVPFKPVYHHIK